MTDIGDIVIVAGFAPNLPQLTAQLLEAERMAAQVFKPIPITFKFTPPSALLGKFEADMKAVTSGVQLQTREVAALVAQHQALGAALKANGGRPGGLPSSTPSALPPLRDTGLQAAARGVKILTDEYKQGGLSIMEYEQRALQLRTTLELLGKQAQPLSRDMATVQSALARLAEAEGQAGKSSPIAERFRLETAAADAAAKGMNLYRLAWQRGASGDTETVNSMRLLEKGILASKTAYEQEAAALQAKGVLDSAETKRLAELIGLQEKLGMALRTSASVQAEVNGEFLKGSLGMNVQRGVAAALKDTAAETERLVNAEKAGLMTKKELRTALAGQVTEQKAALEGVIAEIAATKDLGIVQLGNVKKIQELSAAQNGYTRALAETVAAQERSAGMSARGALMGGAGLKAGLNDAGMALSFVSPQAGMLGMLAGSGPIVAGAAAIGLGIAGIVKLTKDGQDEAKKLQTAYLNLQVNGVQDIKAVDTALNQMIQTGSTSDRMFSKAELAGALAQLSRSGFKGAEGMAALSSATRLAAVENIPLTEATKNLASNLQHLNMTGTEAATFGDKLVRASHLTQDSANDFSKGMNVIGFTAQKLGYSIDETMGMLVALSRKGLDPATIGSTGLRNAMQLIEHPSKKAAAAMAELGVATVDSSGHARTGRDIFMDLMNTVSASGPVYSKTTGHLMTENDRAALNFILFGTRSATAFIGVQHGAKEAADDISKSQGFMTEASDKTASSLENTQKRQTAAMKNLASAFAKSFTGILTDAATGIADFLTSITPTMNKISDFIEMLNKAQGFKEISTTLKINAGDGFTLSAVKLLTGGAVIVGGVAGFVGKSIGDQISADALQVELLKRNILQPSMIPIAGPLAQLNMIKEDMAYYIKAVNDYDAKHAAATDKAVPGLFAPGDARGLVIPTSASGPIGAANMNVLGATLGQTGNPEADNLIGWCARWVKLTLDKAQPGAKAEIDKWFAGDANDVKNRLLANKKLEKYSGNVNDLKPGDVVVYDDNHIGIYIGNGMVRGNNKLGGRNGAPVTDESLTRLGSIAGIVRAAAAVSGFTGMAPSLTAAPKPPPEMDPNFKGSTATSLKALKDEMLRLTAAFKSGKMDIDAYHSAVEVLRQKAGALADTQKTGSKEWTSTEQFIIKASNALKSHTAATQQAALTWAQYKPLREQALKLAQQESDMNDHKLTPQAETALKGTLQNYRNDPVHALALEQASQELADRQKHSEDAKKVSDQVKKDADKAEADRQKAQDTAAKNMLAAEKFLNEGKGELAKQSAQAVITGYDAQVKAAGSSASAILLIEQAWRQKRLNAMNALTNAQAMIDKQKLEHGAHDAESADGVTKAERVKIEAQLAARLAQIDKETTAKRVQNAAEVTNAVKTAADNQLQVVKTNAAKVATALADVLANPDQYQDGGKALAAAKSTNTFTASLADLEKIFPTSADEADGFSKALDEMAAAGNISNDTLKTMKARLDDLRQNGFNNGLIQELAAGGAYANVSDGGRMPSGTDFQTLDPTQQNKPSYDLNSFKEYTDTLSKVDFNAFIKAAGFTDDEIKTLTDSWVALDAAVSKTLDDIAKHPEDYADGARGLAPRSTYDPNRAAVDLANQDSVNGSNQAMDSTRLEAQHAQGLISEQTYLNKKRELDDTANVNAFQIADRDQSKHAANLAAYNAQMLGIDQKYNTDKKVLDDKGRADAEAMRQQVMASGIATAQATLKTAHDALDIQHTQGLVSDRAFQIKREQQDLDALDANFQASKISLEDYENEYTRIKAQGVKDREALDKAGIDSLVQGLQSLGGTFGQLDGLAGLFGKTLSSIGTGIQMFQKIPDLMTKTSGAMKSGNVFDLAGVAGGWLGMASEAINLIGSLGDAIMNLDPGYQKWKKNMLDIASLESSAAGSKKTGLLTNPYYDALQEDSQKRTTLANAGFWQKLAWNIFGGAPVALSDEAAKFKTAAGLIFTDLGTSISNSLSTNLLAAVKSGNLLNITDILKHELDDFITKAAIDAVIAKSNLSKLISNYADDAAAGRSTSADIAGIRAEENKVVGQVQVIAPSLPSYYADGLTGANSQASVIGAGPSALYGMPTMPELKFPASVMQSFDAFATTMPVFAAGSQRMLDAGNMIVDALGPQAVGRSGRGGLL